jgi:hypothetical protein
VRRAHAATCIKTSKSFRQREWVASQGQREAATGRESRRMGILRLAKGQGAYVYQNPSTPTSLRRTAPCNKKEGFRHTRSNAPVSEKPLTAEARFPRISLLGHS